MAPKDLSVITAVVLIIIMLIIPLPTWLISIFIIFNIALSLLVLLISMNMREALDFSVFPSLLLLLTLFRLALNVSTTRSILSKGDAGAVIETFGSFVIGGDVLVGLVVFFILVIIQFIVITKGAERVSEVAARFTLDAMPGKQMSVDADLNAGLISEAEARRRREKISREADFYGAMDGASKFVKGDAIAGLVIVIINLIFGLIIGMVREGLDIGEAANKYLLLTVGDGIGSQLPALLVSTSMAIIVTRAASDGNLGSDVTKQLFAFPKMLYITAGTIFLLGLFTPIDDILTIPVAILLALGGYQLSKEKSREIHVPDEGLEEEAAEELRKPENILQLLNVDPIEFEFGYGLIPLADANQGGDLLDRVVMIRRQLAIELGMILPVVRIRDNIQLAPNEYRIKIKGTEVGKGELLLDHYLAMSPGVEDPSIVGIDTVEPAFGMPAKWIREEMKAKAEMAGYTVVDPPSVVSTHLTEIFKRYAYQLLGRQETKQLIDHLKQSNELLVEEVTPNPLSVGDVQKVLSKLLKERISIRNLPVIFETLADSVKITTDPDVLAEYVRQALARQITEQYTKGSDLLKVITLSGSVEKLIADSVQQTEHGHYLSIDPQKAQIILQNMANQIEQMQKQNEQPIILCSPAVRMYVRELTERYFPEVPILSYNELEANVQVQSFGVVNMD